MPPLRPNVFSISLTRTLPRPLSRRLLTTTSPLYLRIKPTMHPRPPRSSPTSPSEPLPEDIYSSTMPMPTINIYEQDADQSTPPQLLDRITTWSELRHKRRAHEEQRAAMDAESASLEGDNEDGAAELPEDVQVPLRMRIKSAERDPVHTASMRAMEISELEGLDRDAEKKVERLNAALKMGYVGANRVVQREMWKAYLLAREVPGLLKKMPNEAWDMVYWSQASMPLEHPGRERVMGILDGDLKSVGKNGPPTDMLAMQDEEEEEDEEDENEEGNEMMEDDEEGEDFEDMDGLEELLLSMDPKTGDAEMDQALAEYGLELDPEELEQFKRDRQSWVDTMNAQGNDENEDEDEFDEDIDFNEEDDGVLSDEEMRELLSDEDFEKLNEQHKEKMNSRR